MRFKESLFSLLFVLVSIASLMAQKGLYTGSPEFESEIANYIKFSIPVIGVDDLKEQMEDYVILDIREQNEFQVSHIPGAIHLGYENPHWTKVKDLSSDTKIIVYCSIGYRSERIGEQLFQRGFEQVFNLYGSIFEWANKGYELEDQSYQLTNRLHTYNKDWSKWVRNPNIEKIW